MNPLNNTNRFAILYVDDEKKSLKYFREIFGEKFWVLTGSSSEEGYQILEENKGHIGIVMADQRMPVEKGTQLLERVRKFHPRILRFLITAYSDLDAAIEAVNKGAIYKYITKPWDIPQMEILLRQGLEFFTLLMERDHLLREKLYVLQRMTISNRMVSFSALTANLSHHLRNAMFSISAFLNYWIPQMLRERNLDIEPLKNPDFWLELHPKVQAQAQRVLDLLTDMEYASLTPNFKYSFEIQLHDIVLKAIQRMGEGLNRKGIVAENNIPLSLPSLKVDKRKFDHLFDLFLRYEIESLPEGGRVRFTAQMFPEKSQDIQIVIEDNGQELFHEPINPISDPFTVHRSGSQGPDFNLMACFLIVYHHGGRIRVSRNEGKGSAFIITLPTDPEKISPLYENTELFREMLWDDPLWENLLEQKT